MNTRKISADKWKQFCDAFSREHHGWLVSVAVTGAKPNGGKEPMPTKMLAQNLPLQEIREAQSQGDAEIMITVGEGIDETSFLVENVADLYENTEADKDIGMRIDSANNTSTVVQFRAAAEPENLDGLAKSEL
ncbi:MAG: DUF5335 family protein [Gammaproteobacteria bacterium]|jgi:hypothetical protein